MTYRSARMPVASGYANMCSISRMIDYLCFAGTAEGRVAEYVDHLHEHFVEPCIVRNAAYMPPGAPGFSIEMKSESLIHFRHKGQRS